ncbi:DUF1592 domain-containing protein [Algibacter amylolyticus]|uniref:DUF1592 domain-containing protein n=1 Tax=Algibacter amylolyticus TaxID=1608400 RepID=A0A5M7B2I7_9FLAO|nr:DUF1592 domain-containing protein [Algibacter amylolyticus]KAA5823672.1 DUF1592 domain-containing protein [Algibacter amylolyticus]MBB5267836.1 putative membrane protein [Algibacter amylolyticus]TSJ74160.1 DUF1592 domain-containing protein [Algibacter amylolyticus]
MKNKLILAFVFTLVLLGLLLIPFNGDSENTFIFFLGRFHPIILHLPIGALVVLFVLEIINAKRPELHLHSACNILLWFSVVSVLLTVVLGFFLASSGHYNEDLLNTHQWLGWFTAIICVWLLVLRNKKSAEASNKVSKAYKLFLLVNVVLLSFAGHYGGSLTHGEAYLTKYMPSKMKAVLGVSNQDSYLAMNPNDSTSEAALYFKNNIKPVMQKHCYDCHGPEKEKGGVRLDVLNWDMINGPDAEGWHSALDMINSGEMPPKEEPQLSDQERRDVVDWMTTNLEKAAAAKQASNKGVMRRLTKRQYTNSLNELLGVNVNFGDVLPDDGKSKMGFSNNGSVLQTSALHIDYYQKIAREALDKAIVFRDKPESKKYKVTIGANTGDGKTGAQYGGYQTAAINNKDFTIDVLDENGRPLSSASMTQKDSLLALKNKIGIGMRGSASNRYSVEKEGMLLYSALPAKEVAPKSWQGPSPNLKLLVKEDFPRTGDFVFRVQASKGYLSTSVERLIDLRKKVPARTTPKAIKVVAKDIKNPKGFVLKDKRWLMPDNVANNVKTKFVYKVPKSGIYQVDLVHPYSSEDAMPSYQISLFGGSKEGRVSERLYMDKSLETADQVVTPVTLAYLSKGTHKGYIGGKFFVGFSHIVLTPLAENDPLPQILEQEAKLNSQQYAGVNPSIQVFSGTRTDDGMDYKTFDECVEVNVPFGELKTYEFKGRLENLPIPLAGNQVSGDLANMLTVGLWNNHLVKENSLTGPPLLIKSVEFEAPYHPVWPPNSHTEIFFDSSNKSDKEVYTKEVLNRFMTKAFRRSVTAEELNRYVDFWNSIKHDFDRYEDGVKEVLVAVLCSPNFIYLFEPEDSNSPDNKKSEDEFFLASQLAYFLWNSPPDETLTALAAEGDLHDELPEQIERMVNDSKIARMIHSFTYEWLRLDRHKTMDTDVNEYKDYTRFVKEDMANETYEFISYVLKNNMSILNFIDSDFAMLNQNLAEFYGVEGVKGHQFRPVELPKDLNRGGLLSQGAFLNGHSDGVQAHPIKRAVWLKEKILGDTPPPPPPNVPELDTDTPGFEDMTLKEQLFLHRNKAACLDCHKKIDPYGVVFENYDAVGRYQLTSKGKPIDTKSQLPDGTEVEGVQGIKDYIIRMKKEEFTKSLVEHLYAYALGRDVSFADQKEINKIVENVIEDDFRFQTVIEQIVLSSSFYKKERNWFNKIFGS